MAAFVPVPGCIQTTIAGVIGTHKFAQVWHFANPSHTSGWPAADIQAVVDSLQSNMKTAFQAFMATNTTFQTVTGVDLSNSTPAIAISAPPAWTGTGSGLMTPAMSFMISFKIAARYRGGKPRTYFPPLTAVHENVTDDGWDSSGVTGMQTGMGTVISAVAAVIPGTQHVCPRYTYTYTDDPAKHKYTRTRGAPVTTPVVQSYLGSSKMRSQRRRLAS